MVHGKNSPRSRAASLEEALASISLDAYGSDRIDQLVHQLDAYCISYGLSLPGEALRQCVLHMLLVVEANKICNLTHITDLSDALILHVLDSILLLPSVTDSPDGSMLDMGTGGGFPGVPLSILSGRSSVLCDSVNKKVLAVSSFISRLGLTHVTAVHARFEDLALEMPQRFSTVVARAVAPLNVLLEYAAPLLELHGVLIAAKAHIDDAEMANGLYAAELCGFTFVDSRSFDLPDDKGHREVLMFSRENPSAIDLPRPVGVAKKQPLVIS